MNGSIYYIIVGTVTIITVPAFNVFISRVFLLTRHHFTGIAQEIRMPSSGMYMIILSERISIY